MEKATGKFLHNCSPYAVRKKDDKYENFSLSLQIGNYYDITE